MVDAHSSPAFADQRRISVDGHQPGLPAQEKPGLRDLPFPGHLPVPGCRCRSVRIEAVVPDLVELPVRDVDEEPCDEAGDAVRDILPAAFPAFLEPVVLVRIVVPGHRPGLLVEAVDSPLADRRMGGVSGDVSREHREIRQAVCLPSRPADIEPFPVLLLRLPGQAPESACLPWRILPEPSFHRRKEGVPESLPHGFEGEERDMAELPVAGRIALGDEDMEMGMPFQVPAERVEERYEPELPVLLLSGNRGALEDRSVEGLRDRIEQDVEPAAVFPEPRPEPLRHREDELPVRDVVQLLLDGKRDQVPVLLPAGRAEPGLAGEPDEDVVVAFRAFRNPVPVLQLAAFERLLHVLDDRRPCQLRRILLLEILPAFLDDVPDADLSALSPRLEGVAESAYEIGQGVASGVSRNQKPLTELAFLVVGLLCEVRMRITAPLHDDMLASAHRKRLARRLATR